MIKQIEEDADREILGIRAKYEWILKEEKDTSLQWKDEIGIMRKKVNGPISHIFAMFLFLQKSF